MGCTSVVYAFSFSLADAGATVMAAYAALPAGGGVIDASGLAGSTFTTPIFLGDPSGDGSKPAVLYFGPGVYTFAAPITLYSGCSIQGVPVGNVLPPSGTLNVGAVLIAAADAGITTGLVCCGTDTAPANSTSLNQLTIDGNAANGGTTGAGVCVLYRNAGRGSLLDVTARNAASHGVSMTNSGSAKILRCMLAGNGGSGLYLHLQSDVLVLMTEMENNQRYGAEMRDTTSNRFTQDDFGGNVLGGIYESSAVADGGPYGGLHWIVGCQFGNQLGHDINIEGWDSVAGTVTSRGHVIVGNSFIGCGTIADNTYDQIHIVDSGQSTISGNFFINSPSGTNRFAYAIHIAIVHSGGAGDYNVVGSNVASSPPNWPNGGLPFSLAPLTIASGNNEANLGHVLTTNPYLRNAQTLSWLDASGAMVGTMLLDATNTLYIGGHPTQQQVIIQPLGGSSTGQVKCTIAGIDSPILLYPSIARFDNATHDHQSGPGGGVLTGAAIGGPLGAITPPSGGSTVDSQARTAIDNIITALQTLGLIS
jgi:hypothetical protein